MTDCGFEGESSFVFPRLPRYCGLLRYFRGLFVWRLLLSLLLPLRYRALPRRGRVTSSSDTVSDGTPCLGWVMRNAEKKKG